MYEAKGGTIRDRSYFIGLLALAGLGVSLYLARIHYFLYGHPEYQKFFCDVNGTFDCSYVVSSAWSEIVPEVPTAALAAGCFLAMFVLHVAFRRKGRAESLAVGFVLSMAAAITAAGYLAVMIFVLKHGCVLCLMLDVIIAATAGVYLWNFKRWRIFRDVSIGGMLGVAVVAVACIAGTVVGLRYVLARELYQRVGELIAQIEMTPETPLPFDEPDPSRVTLYVFSDMQCPACRQGHTITQKLHEIYGDKLRIVYKNFPLDKACNNNIAKSSHPGSCAAARVALAAGEHGRYKEVVDEMFADQSQIAERVKQLEADPQSHAGLERADAALQKDIADGAAVNIKVTPTYFLNGRKIAGPQPLPVWTAVINEMLDERGPAATQR